MTPDEMAADALEEAWEAVVEAWRHAMRRLADHPLYPSADAYGGRVFDPDDRLVGMQSVNEWVAVVARALRGDEGEDDDA